MDDRDEEFYLQEEEFCCESCECIFYVYDDYIEHSMIVHNVEI